MIVCVGEKSVAQKCHERNSIPAIGLALVL